ncbi:L7Ae/L30e/S12e/Gadd45 family ribosomal protein [Acetilactobacillus jinshanensis]|uniref:L7Ae/L30e/S12e/Gadd45 family ribosomal protein n=1 Tax=Acetilactobacillus jinshanensis TaxID=1720083 RepID=UPI0013A61AA2|nr:ribosomal L7Ae/L30e/S12e/Gadd45 family protein [Acetilactobacillus jinshanensis]URL60821.1 hypothetical protein HGK75_02100 [uncultured bacterium]
MGIAQGAGKIISGENTLIMKIKAHQIGFLIIAADAGQATSKKFHDKASSHKIPLNDQFTKKELSHAIGRNRIVMGLQDRGFVNHLIELNQNTKG